MRNENHREQMVMRVEEINLATSGRGLCSSGIDVAKELKIKPGELVEIAGKKRTCGIFFPNSADRGKNVLRLDDIMCFNAGTEYGQTVTICKAVVQAAKRVVLKPVDTVASLDSKKIRDMLMNRPCTVGDRIELWNVPAWAERGEFHEDDGRGRKKKVILDELLLDVFETDPGGCIVQIIIPGTTLEITY